jgi:hypothetical protein
VSCNPEVGALSHVPFITMIEYTKATAKAAERAHINPMGVIISK